MELLLNVHGERLNDMILYANEVLSKWPDQLRILTPALKRSLQNPPYPKSLQLVRHFDLRYFENSIYDVDSLKLLFNESELHRLNSISLRYCSFGDEGVKLICNHLTDLHKLTLGYCNIGDADVITIANAVSCSKLETLSLYSNLITDIGTQALCTSPHLNQLTTINLYNNKISSAMCDELKEKMKNSNCKLIIHHQCHNRFNFY